MTILPFEPFNPVPTNVPENLATAMPVLAAVKTLKFVGSVTAIEGAALFVG